MNNLARSEHAAAANSIPRTSRSKRLGLVESQLEIVHLYAPQQMTTEFLNKTYAARTIGIARHLQDISVDYM